MSVVVNELAVRAAVDQLKADGVEVTWRVGQQKAPGTPTADEVLFVHIVRARVQPSRARAVVLIALLKVCTQVRVD